MGKVTKLLDALVREYGDDVVQTVRRALGDAAQPEQIEAAVKRTAKPRTATRTVRPAATAQVSRVERRKREAPKVENLTVRLSPKRHAKPEQFDLTQHEGRGFVTSFSDMAAAGDDILGVNDIDFAVPVQRLGGQDFMFDNPNLVWANDLGGANKHLTAARRSRRQTGRDPLFLPWTMSPTSIDFAHQPRETMLRVASEVLGKRDANKLSKEIAVVLPGFRAIGDEDSVQLFREAAGSSRDKLNRIMDRYREKTGVGLGSARMANTDLDQIDNRLTTLRNVGVIDSQGSPVASDHPSYPYGIPGEGLGVLPSELGVLQLLPELMREKGISGPFDFPVGVQPGKPSPLRALQVKPHIGVLTHEVLKSLEDRPPDFEPPVSWLSGKLREYAAGG